MFYKGKRSENEEWISVDKCKEFFVEHYMKNKDREENTNGKS